MQAFTRGGLGRATRHRTLFASLLGSDIGHFEVRALDLSSRSIAGSFVVGGRGRKGNAEELKLETDGQVFQYVILGGNLECHAEHSGEEDTTADGAGGQHRGGRVHLEVSVQVVHALAECTRDHVVGEDEDLRQ